MGVDSVDIRIMSRQFSTKLLAYIVFRHQGHKGVPEGVECFGLERSAFPLFLSQGIHPCLCDKLVKLHGKAVAAGRGAFRPFGE